MRSSAQWVDCQVIEANRTAGFRSDSGTKYRRHLTKSQAGGKSMKFLISAAIVALLIPSTAGAQDTDQETLQGTWDLVSINVNGKEISKEQFQAFNIQTIYEGNRLIRRDATEQSGDWATFTIDPSTSPRQIDTTNKEGVTEKGIYKFEGDTLTICTRTRSGRERPTKFESNEVHTVRAVWRRAMP